MSSKKKGPAGAAHDLGLPEEPCLTPEEAADAMREAHRISGRPVPPEPVPPVPDTETEPPPLIPWGPLRPDEIAN